MSDEKPKTFAEKLIEVIGDKPVRMTVTVWDDGIIRDRFRYEPPEEQLDEKLDEQPEGETLKP